jgi:DNA-binding NarL/FixJ family response regulator
MSPVLLVDDHPIILTACRQLLQESGFTTVVVAQDAGSGYEAFLQHHPRVVVVDLSLNGRDLDGLALIARIRGHDPAAAILVFSMHADATIIASAIEAGATGYLLKDAAPDELATAVASVASGQRYIDQQLAMKVALLHADGERSPLDHLTARERQVLGLLAEGKPYATIGAELGVSYKTVINLTYRLRQKLDARGLSDLIRIAVELTRARP